MNKLLAANFSRLFKNKLFWALTALSALIGLLLGLYLNTLDIYYNAVIEHFIFYYAFFIGLFAAVFCGMFLGSEYSNGAIRNKLIIGHSRYAVYLANLIVCLAACLMMCLAYFIVYFILGSLLVGGLVIDTGLFLGYLGTSILLILAYVSIYTIISMLITSKATGSVVCIILFIVLLFYAMLVYEKLNVPEYYDNFTSEADNEVQSGGKQIANSDNNNNTDGAVYEFIFDLLPPGQGYQLSSLVDGPIAHIWRLPLLSLFITLATTLSGMLIFRRKNLK